LPFSVIALAVVIGPAAAVSEPPPAPKVMPLVVLDPLSPAVLVVRFAAP
jgi:hypothetical protein